MSEHNSDILSKVVESMSSGVDNQRDGLHQALGRALEGNANMMRILGELMETSYVTEVHLSSAIKPKADGTIDVNFTVHNATSFPIVSMTGEIEFIGPQIEYTTDNSLFQSPKNLNPLTKLTESIQLRSLSDEPMHGKCVITIKHLHPGNGTTLEHIHSFGIYVIDQLIKTSVDKSGSHKFEQRSYPVKFIRDIMEIHPIKGIDIGMCIELSRKNFKVLCQIVGFANDFSSAEIEFSSNEKEAGTVVTRLIKEFDALSG